MVLERYLVELQGFLDLDFLRVVDFRFVFMVGLDIEGVPCRGFRGLCRF